MGAAHPVGWVPWKAAGPGAFLHSVVQMQCARVSSQPVEAEVSPHLAGRSESLESPSVISRSNWALLSQSMF